MSDEQSLIEKINRQVNALNLRETVDEGTGPILGGCRQYVLEKQKRLVEAGIDPSRLQPWTVSIPNQGLHGVLLLDGHTVLDNLNPWPQPKTAMQQGRFGYTFMTHWNPTADAAPQAAKPAAATTTKPPTTAQEMPVGQTAKG